jgi:hypothetical protein
MRPQDAIAQAKAVLVEDRALNAILNRTGTVRVPVLPKAPAFIYKPGEPPSSKPLPVVTFTIEETAFGRRLMAEFEGYKEFAA